jgi:hypothetical protein
MATFTPFAASARAVASPRPDAPPVTTAATVESSFINTPDLFIRHAELVSASYF